MVRAGAGWMKGGDPCGRPWQTSHHPQSVEERAIHFQLCEKDTYIRLNCATLWYNKMFPLKIDHHRREGKAWQKSLMRMYISGAIIFPLNISTLCSKRRGSAAPWSSQTRRAMIW